MMETTEKRTLRIIVRKKMFEHVTSQAIRRQCNVEETGRINNEKERRMERAYLENDTRESY
jgi:hypothetical protein